MSSSSSVQPPPAPAPVVGGGGSCGACPGCSRVNCPCGPFCECGPFCRCVSSLIIESISAVDLQTKYKKGRLGGGLDSSSRGGDGGDGNDKGNTITVKVRVMGMTCTNCTSGVTRAVLALNVPPKKKGSAVVTLTAEEISRQTSKVVSCDVSLIMAEATVVISAPPTGCSPDAYGPMDYLSPADVQTCIDDVGFDATLISAVSNWVVGPIPSSSTGGFAVLDDASDLKSATTTTTTAGVALLQEVTVMVSFGGGGGGKPEDAAASAAAKEHLVAEVVKALRRACGDDDSSFRVSLPGGAAAAASSSSEQAVSDPQLPVVGSSHKKLAVPIWLRSALSLSSSKRAGGKASSSPSSPFPLKLEYSGSSSAGPRSVLAAIRLASPPPALELSAERAASSSALHAEKAPPLPPPGQINSGAAPFFVGTMPPPSSPFADVQRLQAIALQKKKREMVYALSLTIPILIITMVIGKMPMSTPSRMSLMSPVPGVPGLTIESLVLFLLATPVQFVCGAPFYRGSYKNIVGTGVLGMDVLIALGTTAAYAYGLASIIVMMVYANKSADGGESATDDMGGMNHDGASEDTGAKPPAGIAEGVMFLETSSVLIAFVLLGKWLQGVATRTTGNAVGNLMKMQPKTAVLIELKPTQDETTMTKTNTKTTLNEDGLPPFDDTARMTEELVDVNLLQRGDIVKVIRGSAVPADGRILSGLISVDESMVTGESVPVLKVRPASAIGGTIVVEGFAYVLIDNVGADSALSQIVSLMTAAQNSKTNVQDFADRVSTKFVPFVVSCALLSFLVWFILTMTNVIPPSYYDENLSPITFSLMFLISTLVIACPCALGLAAPTAIMVGTGVGAKHGILIKGGEALESASKVSDVIFDKTGTLTVGKPGVTEICWTSGAGGGVVSGGGGGGCGVAASSCCGGGGGGGGGGADVGVGGGGDCCSGCNVAATSVQLPPAEEADLLYLLACVEKSSEHPLATAMVHYAMARLGDGPNGLKRTDLLDAIYTPSDFVAATGKGVTCIVSDKKVCVGNRSFIAHQGGGLAPSAEVESKLLEMEETGKTAILMSVDGTVRAAIAIADELKPDSFETVKRLQSIGVTVWMVTGDNRRTARAIARQVGISDLNIVAEALPATKVRRVEELQKAGRFVAMVGDGINDSPALVQADLGIAIGAGTQIAIEAGDMVLVRNQVMDVVVALELSRAIFRRIQLNFVWALGYNALAIPVAMGLGYPIYKTMLPPSVAGILMALSSVSVVMSSLALKFWRMSKF